LSTFRSNRLSINVPWAGGKPGKGVNCKRKDASEEEGQRVGAKTLFWKVERAKRGVSRRGGIARDRGYFSIHLFLLNSKEEGELNRRDQSSKKEKSQDRPRQKFEKPGRRTNEN